MAIYTHAVWTVQPGREDDFVELWDELGRWTVSRFPDATGTLLRSREHPNRFVSFGPWGSLDEVAAWRSAPEWQEVVAKIQRLLESFEPGTYDVASSQPTSSSD